MEDIVLYLLFEIEYQKDIRDTTMTRFDHDWKQGHIDMLQVVVNNITGK